MKKLQSKSIKTYRIHFMSSDNVKKVTEVAATSKSDALKTAKNNYRGYKNFR